MEREQLQAQAREKERQRIQRLQQLAASPAPLPKLCAWSIDRSKERQDRMEKVQERKKVTCVCFVGKPVQAAKEEERIRNAEQAKQAAAAAREAAVRELAMRAEERRLVAREARLRREIAAARRPGVSLPFTSIEIPNLQNIYHHRRCV